MPALRVQIAQVDKDDELDDDSDDDDHTAGLTRIQRKIEIIAGRMAEEAKVFDPKEDEDHAEEDETPEEEEAEEYEEGDEFLTEAELAEKRKKKALRAYQQRINDKAQEEKEMEDDEEITCATDHLDRALDFVGSMHAHQREKYLQNAKGAEPLLHLPQNDQLINF